MTLSPLQRLLTGIVLALVVVAAALGYQYVVALQQRAVLLGRLANLQATVDKLNQRAAKGDDPLLRDPAFPVKPLNLELAGIVLDSAAASGVSTGALQSTTLATEKVGANAYRTATLNLTVTGAFPQILDFFDRVERGGIRTVVFDNIHVEPSNDRWTVQLQLIAYSQPG